MDRNKLIERLMTTFLGELEDHVRTINEVLLAIEKDPEGPGIADGFKTLLRVAHSLKGAARSVGVAPIEEACHRIEEILSAARDGRRALDADRFALLFATADAIEEAGMRLREQQDLAGSPLSEILPHLEAAAAGAGAAAFIPISGPPRLAPASPPAPDAPAGPAALPSPSAQANRPEEESAARPEPELEAPASASATASSPAAPLASPATAAVEHERPALGSAFVRIPATKLDDMLTSTGELLVARRGVALRTGELESIRDFVARWRAEWQQAERELNRLVPSEGNGSDVGLKSGAETIASQVAPGSLPRSAAEALGRVGERLGRLERDLDHFVTAMGAGERQLDRAAGRLDDEVRRVRMLPFADACQGLERTARDVARAEGKQVELIIEGGDVELDRSVLEGLRDPLNHLVRNAVDHGLELPEARRAAGKPDVGRITVAAALRGSQVEVVVTDDGTGLDFEAIRDRARECGLGNPSDAHILSDLIFLPGFSTTRVVTPISGRGVGLDVVKSRLEALQGTVEITSLFGRGARFTMAVPLTLTTLRVLLVEAAGQTFALASSCVPKLVRVDPAAFRTIEGRAMLVGEGSPLPVYELSAVLSLPAREPSAAPAAAPANAPGACRRPAVLVAAGDRRAAFLVDGLITEQEIIVKSLGERIRRVRNIAGATILPTGRIAPVINAAHLVRSALVRRPGAPSPLPPSRESSGVAPASTPTKRRLLVVDDSLTTRTLQKSILEAAGYEVLTAVDGESGWQVLQEQGADLVVTDLEMPRMDGFALTETIRNSTRFADLPVVLLTSLASDRDRSRGIEVGADAYIVKGAFDQDDLLKTIAQLL